METLHLLLLCCYGGVPYIEYGDLNENVRHESTHTIDPTDWIAVDTPGSLLNETIHPEFNSSYDRLIPTDFNVPLDQCDLFNLTFSSTADQALFNVHHGLLKCRCPRRRFGSSCHLKTPTIGSGGVAQVAAALIAMDTETSGSPFNMIILCFMCLIIMMSGIFMMVRGCFCDCFGGFKNPFTHAYDRPLDPDAVNRCLSAIRTYEDNQKTQYGVETQRPLISSISEGCAPYNSPVLPAGCYEVVPPPLPRNCSPPPSYRSVQGSFENLPGNTKL
ncbi:hypothetical protein M3Y98_00593900 [Aphelenchoides besseyi]|nr:hypothetical protein M3Y98_00593900 [Aphelenchoides besseyi]KAI6194002.1 hypothetical protein M3Y96_01078800 [Aphelenchoides besseyi]